MNLTYEELVKRGKQAIKEIDNLQEITNAYQAKIAKYALSVCEIRHGGRSKNIYTIKDYAIAIGLNRKTLSNWIAIYRNVLEKIGIEEPSIEEWRKATKVNNILKIDRLIDNRNNNRPKGSRGAYKKNIPAERVGELFSDIENKPFINECNSLIKSNQYTNGIVKKHGGDLSKIPEHELQRVESNANYTKEVLEKRDLTIAPEERLLFLMQILDDTSDMINDYLTAQRNKVRIA